MQFNATKKQIGITTIALLAVGLILATPALVSAWTGSCSTAYTNLGTVTASNNGLYTLRQGDPFTVPSGNAWCFGLNVDVPVSTSTVTHTSTTTLPASTTTSTSTKTLISTQTSTIVSPTTITATTTSTVTSTGILTVTGPTTTVTSTETIVLPPVVTTATSTVTQTDTSTTTATSTVTQTSSIISVSTVKPSPASWELVIYYPGTPYSAGSITVSVNTPPSTQTISYQSFLNSQAFIVYGAGYVGQTSVTISWGSNSFTIPLPTTPTPLSGLISFSGSGYSGYYTASN